MDSRGLAYLGLPLVSSWLQESAAAAARPPGKPVACAKHLSGDAAVADQQLPAPASPVPVQYTREARPLAEAMLRPLRSSGGDPKAHQLSVVSFNMLLKGFQDKPYYPGVSPALRAWSRRKWQVQELLLKLDADIYCMQEVEVATFSTEFAFLSEAGYSWVEPVDDSKGKHPEMAKPAIFFKADVLEKVWQEQRSRTVLGAFRHRTSGHMLYVVSCHLEGAPWQAAARFAQARKSLDAIKKQMLKHQKELGTDPGSSSLIFAGDFNELEDSAVCQCLRTGGLLSSWRDPRLPDEELTKADYWHGFQLADLYSSDWASCQKACQSTRPPTFCAPAEETAAWGSTPSFAAVDFVFYSPATLRPAAVRQPFTDAQRVATEGLGIPSDWHFSDHVPIGGVFQLKAAAADPPPEEDQTDVLIV